MLVLLVLFMLYSYGSCSGSFPQWSADVVPTGYSGFVGGGLYDQVQCCDNVDSYCCLSQVVCCPDWYGSGYYACCPSGTTCSLTPGVCNDAPSDGLSTTTIVYIVVGVCVGVGAIILGVLGYRCRRRAQYDRV